MSIRQGRCVCVCVIAFKSSTFQTGRLHLKCMGRQGHAGLSLLKVRAHSQWPYVIGANTPSETNDDFRLLSTIPWHAQAQANYTSALAATKTWIASLTSTAPLQAFTVVA